MKKYYITDDEILGGYTMSTAKEAAQSRNTIGGLTMDYTTTDFDNLLDEITAETERIKSEMNIYKFNHADNVYTYNRLTTILLRLQSIK